MKRTLSEELERIHTMTYGKNVIVQENLIDKILNKIGLKKDDKKVDDPKKADLVSDDVKEFYGTLENAIEQGGISQASVLKGDKYYYMWYSYRNKIDYRIDKKNSYKKIL
jgi:hypothetical protein